MRLIFGAFFTVLCLLFIPLVPVFGVSVTLQPNRVYEFVGNDSRVISHINVTGTGRYQIVSWDSYGEVTRFGFAGGRFSVSGTGGVAVTPLSPLAVSFDPSRLTLREEAGLALRQIEVPAGSTLSLQNSHDSGLHIRTNQALDYDYAVFSRVGNSTGFERLVNLPQFSVPAGGTVMLTPEPGEDLLTVYFPSRWYSEKIFASSLQHPALSVVNLYEGQAYALANSDSTSFSMRLSPSAIDDGAVSYDYVIRGRDGHVINHGTNEGNRLQLAAHQSLTLTPLMNGELFFPYKWLEYISVLHGVETPVYRALYPEQTLTIVNRESSRSHTVFIRCALDAGDFSFDFVLVDGDNVTFDTIENFVGGQSNLSLPAGGVLTITALDAAPRLAVSFPDLDAVSARVGVTEALVRHSLEPGMSVFISNDGDDNLRLLPLLPDTENNDDEDEEAPSRDTIKIDYVRRDIDSNDVLSFGRAEAEAHFVLPEGQTAIITNPTDTEVILNFPQIYAVTLEATSETALFRRVLTSGEAVHIENTDRRYNHSFLVQNESTRTLAAGTNIFEYVRYAFRENLVDFGESQAGYVEIPSGGRVIFMPLDSLTNAEISISFPNQWRGGYLRVNDAAESPLHRITLPPGERTTIANRTRNDFALHNNSATTAAGYHLSIMPPAQAVTELFFIDYETGSRGYVERFVQDPIYRGSDIAPLQGPIELPSQYEITITSTRGASLELWLPRRWARQLRL